MFRDQRSFHAKTKTVMSVTKRLLFHRRLQYRSRAARNGSFPPFQTTGNTKGIGQQFNLFHLFSGGNFPIRRTIGLE